MALRARTPRCAAPAGWSAGGSRSAARTSAGTVRWPRSSRTLCQVFVALYDVTDADALQLDRWEAADLALYRKIRVRVAHARRGRAAWLYVLDDYEGGLPSARYLGLIADAAEAAGAPDDYVSELRARPCRSVGPGS